MAKIIHNYRARGSGISWEENGEYTQGTSNTLSSNEDLLFTGFTYIYGPAGNRDVTFSAPNIKMESEIRVSNLEENSITFENTIVNFDSATWDADPSIQGKLIFSGESKLNLTSKSNKLLIICNDISGTITLELDDSFVSGSTFSIQANRANNLIINNAEGYEVIPTTDGTITTYTVNKAVKGKEIKTIVAGGETYYLKDETARKDIERLSKVAKTGSYNDLSDKPTIPTKTSELENDKGFIGEQGLSEYAKDTKITRVSTDYVFNLDENDNEILYAENASVIVIFPPSTMVLGFLKETNFTSGSTPTTLSIFNGTIPLVWLGDDITDGVFVPVANKRYTLLAYCDGINYRIIVKGVPYVS